MGHVSRRDIGKNRVVELITSEISGLISHLMLGIVVVLYLG